LSLVRFSNSARILLESVPTATPVSNETQATFHFCEHNYGIRF
jgi:hypothetical protein